jgi:hypothetical protein
MAFHPQTRYIEKRRRGLAADGAFGDPHHRGRLYLPNCTSSTWKKAHPGICRAGAATGRSIEAGGVGLLLGAGSSLYNMFTAF